MVHADAAALPGGVQTKAQFYEHIVGQIEALLGGQRNWVTNLSNASSVIYNSMNRFHAWENKPVNWAGFYLLARLFPPTNAASPMTTKTGAPLLLLGPFHGLPACQQIPSVVGKGVCADASAKRPPTTVVVGDTEKYPGHIACDSASRSEIVVPIRVPFDRLGDRTRDERTGWPVEEAGAKETVVGVLDIDCTVEEGFDEEDRIGLERIVKVIVDACDF